jgi:acyl-CoA thioester hydrolase
MSRTRIALPGSFPFRTEIPVRITDINYGGHLGNDAVLSLLQEARVRFLRQFGFAERDIAGVGIIMLDAVVLYKAEAFYGDSLLIDVCATDLESHGCDFVYRITNKESGREVVRAKTSVAFFDYVERKVVPIPETFKTRMVPGAG